MSIDTVAGLLDVLRAHRLLEPQQLNDLLQRQGQFADPRALARELVQRGWLTAFQVNQVFRGQAAALVLGQYVLLERIGEGGMGQVYKARHLRLGRAVALKLIRPERLSNQDVIQRFQREARAAAHLSHPNIVTIHDADEVGGTHFFAMEYVEGTDLAKLVKQQGKLPVPVACEYVRQAALGLQHAHEKGIVHRDIKPHNLFLVLPGGAKSFSSSTPPGGGQVKILDMGLARLNVTLGSDSATEALTREGAVMGTPDYIAPEQAVSSHSVDIRADLYSLGCTLYHLLTGRPPFPGGSLAQKLVQHQMQQPQPVESLRPEVPPALANVVRKLMAKDPAQRYQTPAEVAAALVPFCPCNEPTAVGTGVRPVPIALPVQAGSSATAPIATALPAGATGSATIPTAMPLSAELATHGGDTTMPVASPIGSGRLRRDWRRLAALGGGVLVLVILLILILRPGGGDSTDEKKGDNKRAEWPLDNLKTAEFRSVKEFDDWPPKGLVLVLGSHRGRHWGPVRAVAYSPDGKLVASGGDDSLICIWGAEDLKERVLIRGHAGKVLSLAFSPDSKQLLSGGEDRTARLWDANDGKELQKWEAHNDPVRSVAFRGTTGRQVLTAGGGGVDASIRLWDLGSVEKPVRTLAGHPGGTKGLSVTPDGRRLVTGGADRRVCLWEVADGKKLKEFGANLEGFQGVFSVALSPDGRRVLCGSQNSIHQWDAETEASLPVVPNAFFSTLDTVSFSADSKRAVFGGDTPVVIVWQADNGQELRRFEGHARPLTSTVFSPDGRRILSGSEDGTIRLWDIETNKEVLPRPGHNRAVHSVALSKDGRHVLTGGADGGVRLWDLTSEPPGRELRLFEPRHANEVTCVLFSPDGYGVSASRDGTVRLWDLESGKEVRRFQADTPVLSATLSADGKRIGCNTGVTLWAWDVETRNELCRITVRAADLHWTAFSPDGLFLLAGGLQHGASGFVRMWSVESGKQERGFDGQPNIATSRIVCSPAGRRILAGSDDGSVRLWEIGKDASQQTPVFGGHRKAITSVAYSLDGRSLAASAIDGKVIIWDAVSAKRRYEWKLPGAVHGVAFDEKGRHLATANANGTVFILRLEQAGEAASGK